MDECRICKSKIPTPILNNAGIHEVHCPQCGDFKMREDGMVAAYNLNISDRQTANAIGWLRQNQNHLVTEANLDQLLSVDPPSFHERADILLLTIEKKTTYAGEYIDNTTLWAASCSCVNPTELDEIIGFLSASNRVELSNETGTRNTKIKPEGWARLEELKRVNTDSKQCFVAMWFDSSMQDIYDLVISVAIDNAGYKPHKVDQREHNGKIDDEIIAQIKKSRFVLADFTGHRGGVYYEAGFAKGLGLEVIWTCREDDMDSLHFDIRQYNCIVWKPDELNEFKKRIKNRIEAVI